MLFAGQKHLTFLRLFILHPTSKQTVSYGYGAFNIEMASSRESDVSQNALDRMKVEASPRNEAPNGDSAVFFQMAGQTRNQNRYGICCNAFVQLSAPQIDGTTLQSQYEHYAGDTIY